MRSLFYALLLLCATPAWAQFSPQAGIAGSTAIAATSPQFKGWATACAVQRGYRDIAQPDSGKTSAGFEINATGAPDNSIVSLGDSGVATVQFATPLRNGAGPDFAVFENGFADPVNPEEAYLELAFVEVSSDGINFFRFPAQFAGDTVAQLAGVGSYMNCRTLHNLAGKYRGGWGTPFDLSDLPLNPLLNPESITHVRVIDVVGSLGAGGSRDAQGRKINDPYPTPFPTGGFDLDAVGGIHFATAAGLTPVANTNGWKLFPNPATNEIGVAGLTEPVSFQLLSLTGAAVYAGTLAGGETISTAHLPAGIYFLKITAANGTSWHSRFVK